MLLCCSNLNGLSKQKIITSIRTFRTVTNIFKQEIKKFSKYIILVRHGEKLDKKTTSTQQKYHQFDPELSEKGKSQADEVGQLIKKYLTDNNILNQTNSNKNIQNSYDIGIRFLVSPFTRAILSAIRIKNQIIIEKDVNK